METIGSFDEFKRLLPDNIAHSHPERQRALEAYLSSGGIIKLDFSRGFPTLVYPSRSRLEGQIEKTEKKVSRLESQIREWNKRRTHLQTNKVGDFVMRFADPLFWEHQVKLLSDPGYRETYDLVSPPMHLVHRKEWKKRLSMFVRSKEYRLRLHEARTSAIGKKRPPMRDEVEARLDFNRQTADRERSKLTQKKRDLLSLLSALRVMLAWAGQ
jgi:hypothetical protein